VKESKSPQQKKALFYQKDHHVTAEYPQSFARTWPRKKARANRKYRRQVRQILAESATQDEREDQGAVSLRSLPVRRDPVRKWGPPLSMREWVTSRLENRLRRTAWNYFRQPYDRGRHRERFIGFLKEITAGQSEYSRQFARCMNELLEPPEPVEPVRTLEQLARGEGRHEMCGGERHACLFDRSERTTGASGG
jgi:hypothetical protein